MSVFVGSCLSMCPRSERKLRIKTKRVHILEKDDESDLMVKEFIRAGAGNKVDPTELRPANILLKTALYLIDKIIPRKDLPFHEVYNFVFDRFRAIRQDMTIQQIEGDIAIKIYEIISRFLIYSSYRLCNEAERFCSPTNMKHLVECLNKLASLYETGHHKAEFLSYQLLACYGNVGVIMYALNQGCVRQNVMVKTALSMNMAWIQGNHFKVLKLAQNLTPLQACIFQHKLNLVRLSLLQIMSSAYSVKNVSFPLMHLSDILLFRGESEVEECKDLIASCGFRVVNDERVTFVGKKFAMPSVSPSTSSWVESRLNTDLRILLFGSSYDDDSEEVISMTKDIKISS